MKKNKAERQMRELKTYIGDLKVKIIDQQQIINELREREAAVERYRENCNRNRQFCDDATNWLGPFSDRSLVALRRLVRDMEGIHDGYHTVEGRYPWQGGEGDDEDEI